MAYEDQHLLYKQFNELFPYEKLKELTLDQYTNQNKTAFIYWLEFKTKPLGSIGADDSFKFGIYRRNRDPKVDPAGIKVFDERYAWYSKLGANPEDAFATVRNAVVRIANYAKELDYYAIENETGIFTDVVKWKIAYLYSDEKLIPYYSLKRLKVISAYLGMVVTDDVTIADIQKYLVEKREGKDIYQYAKELDDIWFSIEGKESKTVWMWLLMNDKERIFESRRLVCGDSIAGKIKDFESYKDYKSFREDYRTARGNRDGSLAKAYWNFMNVVKDGDIVVVFKNNKVQGIREHSVNHHDLLGWGTCKGDIIFDYDNPAPLQREVEWKGILSNAITTDIVRNSLFFHKTTPEQAVEIMKLLGNINSENVQSMKADDNMFYNDIKAKLEASHNLVLTGAPGTGKTYMANEIAKLMGAKTMFVQFHPSYDYTDFVEGLRPIKENGMIGFERKDGVFKDFCKMAMEQSPENAEIALSRFKEDIKHKSISIPYIDRPNKKPFTVTLGANNNIVVSIDGGNPQSATEENIIASINAGHRIGEQTYPYCIGDYIKKQYMNDKPYVFIIDEINRGEASKIFGELFFAIDPGYRGKKDIMVKTQYQNLVPEKDVFAEGFYVPKNVYILATMNDIDRSVESMDFAMRRRFTWIEVSPDDTAFMLDNQIPSWATEAKAAMKRLNEKIKEEDGLGAAYMIGPAYFLKLRDYKGNLDSLWNMNLEPLLKEYLRGFRNAKTILERFRKAYNNETETPSTDNQQ